MTGIVTRLGTRGDVHAKMLLAALDSIVLNTAVLLYTDGCAYHAENEH